MSDKAAERAAKSSGAENFPADPFAWRAWLSAPGTYLTASNPTTRSERGKDSEQGK